MAERTVADRAYAADLEESDTREGFDFPPPERKVVTQSYDLSVQTLLEQWDSGVLILPEIQREYIWDDARASRLVESLILNIPIPVVYLAETADAKYEIIDGHQRIRSVVRYLQNEFRLRSLVVLDEYNGKRLFELPEREQRFLRMRTLRAVILAAESHPNMKFEIFERLNTGSIALNAQELRNSIYRGPLNRLLQTLSGSPAFRMALGVRTKRRRMVDEELVLRFLALSNGYPAYRAPLKRFLNEFMEEFRDAPAERLDAFARTFDAAIGNVVATLDGAAFRVTDATGQPIESVINRALYDAQMLVFGHVAGGLLIARRAAVIREMAALFQDELFDDSIRRATGDRARLRIRVERVAEALTRAGVEVEVPADWT